MPAVSTSTRQTQPAQGCLFWLSATRGWHYIKPCGAWQVLAGGNRDVDGATRGWAPPESLWAPHSLAHLSGQQHMRPPCYWCRCPRDVGMGTVCCACATVPPSLCPGVHPPCQHCSVCQHSRWSMYCISAHGKAGVGWLQTGHAGTLSSSSQSRLPGIPCLCHLPALWVLLPGGCQAGCSPWVLRPCSAGASAGRGSQVPDASASPCRHRVVRCQGCRHPCVAPMGGRGETAGLDPGT